jgi:hypothetical protein
MNVQRTPMKTMLAAGEDPRWAPCGERGNVALGLAGMGGVSRAV